MSLRVWLPLDGDLRNQGVSSVTITPSTSVAVQTDGKIGKCYRPATITLTNLDDFSFNNSSFCFWAKTNATTSWQLIIGIDNSNLSQIHGIYVADTSRYKLEYNPSLNIYNAEIAQWHHYAFIIQSGKSQAYCDGVLKATSDEAVTDDIIGRLRLGVGTAISLNDVRIYDHALSAAEVREISQGLVLHYKLDDLENGIIDSSGYGHHGTILNGPLTLITSPRYNNGVSFTATNKKIKSGTINTIGFSNTYSISWWGKSSTYSGTMHWGFGDGGRLNGIYGGNLWNTGDGANNPLYNPGTTTQVTVPTANEWHHFVMTGDGTTCKAYKDGIFWGQAKTYKSISGTVIYINGWNTSTSYSYSNLQVSDFRLYCTTLFADDILQLYHTSAKIDNKQNLHTFEYMENSTNLFRSELIIPWAKPDRTRIGEIVEHNGTYALNIAPEPFYKNISSTTGGALDGMFQTGSYVFDMWIDTDSVIYNSNNVAGGMSIRYTDNSAENAFVFTGGNKGYQHKIYITPANKNIQRVEFYYYVSTDVFYRVDSCIYPISNLSIKKTGVIQSTGLLEETNTKFIKNGLIETNEIIEL